MLEYQNHQWLGFQASNLNSSDPKSDVLPITPKPKIHRCYITSIWLISTIDGLEKIQVINHQVLVIHWFLIFGPVTAEK